MVRKIYKYPEDKEILSQKSVEVTELTDEIKKIIQDLKDTVVYKHGAGISAIQLGKPYRICVINWDGLHVLINPVVTRSRGQHTLNEGCLSVPGVFTSTTRAQKVWISAKDENWNDIEYAEGGNGSYIAQHELDHFEGTCTLFAAYDKQKEAENNVMDNQEN